MNEQQPSSMPPFGNFTTKAKEVIRRSHELAVERGQNHVNSLHLLSALVLQDESVVVNALERMSIDIVHFIDVLLESIEGEEPASQMSSSYQIYLTPDLANIIESSVKIAQKLGDSHISVEHLFLAVLENPGQTKELINQFRIERKEFLNIIKDLKNSENSGMAEKPKSRTVAKYTRNLSDLALEDKLDPVIGRDKEIMRLIQILTRRTKNNPILIGESGVGKTAIVEGLAIRMSKNDVPDSLKDKQLVSLDMGLLLAGTKYRGEFEDRLKKIMKEIERSQGSIILFIDEIHTLVGAGAGEGHFDAANMLKPALARGELRVIGATTLNEFQKYFEKDAALTRRFQPIQVLEPTIEDSIAILRGLKSKYEIFHGVRITDDAILSAVNLSARYITDRYLPDKAVDLIDEAASSLRISLENKPTELEESHRKIMRFEIEKQALNKEVEADPKNSRKAKNRITKINSEISQLKDSTRELELRWQNEKDILQEIKKNKKEIERNKVEAENAEIKADLGRAAEIRYGIIPVLETGLDKAHKKLKELQKSRRVLREDVGEEDIAMVVSKWTSIPVTRMLEEEIEKLSRLEESLQKRVQGQDEAIEKIANAIRRSRVGISDPNRPIGSFIFLGPTGVGKTELTKALAGELFDNEKSLIRVDMSEYMEKHSISKMIGSPPGYVGHDESGQLTESVRHRPYSVILFDEIEKAHSEVFNLLLQVLDSGHLTDAKGRKVDFKNTVIVMTSNLGAQYIEKMEAVGFNMNTDADSYHESKDKVMQSLKDHFRPEFLNRLDEIIIFDVLSKETIKSIVSLRVEEISNRLSHKGITIELTDKAFDYLAKEGYDPHYGARPLNRLIQNKILNQIATGIVAKTFLPGSVLQVDSDGKSILITTKDSSKTKKTRKVLATS